MSVQQYDQFRTFKTTQAQEFLFVKQEPHLWTGYFEELGVCPDGHVRVFHVTGFMTNDAIVLLTTVIDRPVSIRLPEVDLSKLPVKPTVYLGCAEGLDHATDEFADRLLDCLMYQSPTQRTLDKERFLSHFWAGLELHGRVTVTF